MAAQWAEALLRVRGPVRESWESREMAVRVFLTGTIDYTAPATLLRPFGELAMYFERMGDVPSALAAAYLNQRDYAENRDGLGLGGGYATKRLEETIARLKGQMQRHGLSGH
jgi:hypothetical protein